MPTKLFSTEFFSCLISSETSNRFSLSDYFDTAYRRDYEFCGSLPCEYSHKSVSVTSPFSYEAANLDALCIIHTTKGAGKLFCKRKRHQCRLRPHQRQARGHRLPQKPQACLPAQYLGIHDLFCEHLCPRVPSAKNLRHG